jgi:hypothetical protein
MIDDPHAASDHVGFGTIECRWMRTAPRRVAVVSLRLACFVIMALEQGETSLTSKSVKEHDTGARRRASHYTLW